MPPARAPTLSDAARRRRPPRPGAAADRGREPDAGRRGRAAAALSAGRAGAPRRDHRAAGSGKSTLVAALIAEVRAAGRSVAVIAVDPSSPITGGALLGDRVRMQAYAGDRDVFIRSMASRGHAGGLAATSTAAAAVLDAAGFDLILIETVGTGQSEVEVAAAADTTVVLEAPEMGDEVQAIKAGLLEVADLVVVNKGDKPGAQRTAAQLRAMLVASAPRERRRLAAAAEATGGPDHDGRDRGRRAGAACRAGPPPRRSGGWGSRRPRVSRGPRRRSGRSSRTGCGRGSTMPTMPRRPTALLDEVAEHRLDPYSAADRLLEGLDSRLIGPGPSVDGSGPSAGRMPEPSRVASRSYLVRATQTGSAEEVSPHGQHPQHRPQYRRRRRSTHPRRRGDIRSRLRHRRPAGRESFSARRIRTVPKADFDQQAGGSDEDAAERPEIDDQFEADDEATEPAEAAEPAKAEKPAKVEKHVKVVKAAKPATEADDEDDNDQGENEDNDNNDQGEHDGSDHSGSGAGEHDDGGDSHDGGGD